MRRPHRIIACPDQTTDPTSAAVPTLSGLETSFTVCAFFLGSRSLPRIRSAWVSQDSRLRPIGVPVRAAAFSWIHPAPSGRSRDARGRWRSINEDLYVQTSVCGTAQQRFLADLKLDPTQTKKRVMSCRVARRRDGLWQQVGHFRTLSGRMSTLSVGNQYAASIPMKGACSKQRADKQMTKPPRCFKIRT